MESADYLRLEVARTKISKDMTFSNEKTRIQLEASFDDATSSLSELSAFRSGSVFKIPCENNIMSIGILLVKDVGDVRVVLGDGRINDLSKLSIDNEEAVTINTSIYSIGSSSNRIAKVTFKAEYRQMFSNMKKVPKQHSQQEKVNRHVLPSFRFENLSRKINWNKVRAMNLDRIVRENDTSTLLSCLSEVTRGDVAEEEADSQLLKAIQMTQFAVQYLEASNDFLREKKKVFHSALDAFDDEEDKLDLQIAKLKAKKKAMLREVDSLNEMTAEYTDLLVSLDPELAEKFERSAHAQVLKEAYEEEKEKNKEREMFVLEQREKERARQIKFEKTLLQEKQKENILKRQIQLERLRLEQIALESQLKAREVGVKTVWPETTLSGITSDEIVAFDDKPLRLGKSTWENNSRASPSVDKYATKDNYPSEEISRANDLLMTDVINLDDLENEVENTLVSSTQIKKETTPPKVKRLDHDTENFFGSASPSALKQDIILNTISSSPQLQSEVIIPSQAKRFGEKESDKSVRVIRSLAVRSIESKHSNQPLVEEDFDSNEMDDVQEIEKLSPRDVVSKDEAILKQDNALEDKSSKPSENVDFPTFVSTNARASQAFSVTSISADSLDFPRRLTQTARASVMSSRTAADDFDASRLHEDLFERSSRPYDEEIGIAPEVNSLALSASEEQDISVINISASPLQYNEDTFEKEDDIADYKSDFVYTIQRKNLGGVAADDDVEVLLGTAMFSPSATGNLTGCKDEAGEFGFSASSNTYSSLLVTVPAEVGPLSSSPSSSILSWIDGRAPVDMIELSRALEVFVSAVRLEPIKNSDLSLACRFLGATSTLSSSLSTNGVVVQQLNSFAHMKFDKAACTELSSEIMNEGEDLSLELLLVELVGEDTKILGSAVVNLWVMIEDSCNIMRQEVNFLSTDGSGEMLGVVVVDVKGYHLLQDCA